MKSSFPTRVVLIAAVALVALVAALALAACAAPSHAQVRYTCPMHPDYVSDKPGDCPICGMKLVPLEKTSSKVPAAPREPAVQRAANSSVVSDEVKPIARVPQMPDMPGMPGTASAPPTPTRDASAAAGLAVVHTDAEMARVGGVETVAVITGTLTGTIRAVGSVVTPETGVRQVTTKVTGWVEKLYVNSVGRFVRAGEPLFELYSPELLASQEEYVKARQVARQFAQSSLPEVQRGGQDLAAAARRRLELFDVPPEFLTRLDETGQAQRTITFRAPFSGYVTEKNVLEGQRIEPGMSLLTIADLSRAWVTADIYEAEAAAAQPGRVATVTLPYDGTVKLTGRVDLVYPTLDVATRTIKLRLQFPNPHLALKPGMFVNVELQAQHAQGLVVPDSAVIDTGTRHVVFVQTAAGHFEPRDVEVGLQSDGQIVLRSGVKAGEQVAVAATFLLDSESRLRAAAGAAAHKHD